ncbi:hypothetical protein ACVWZV_000331 [Bradyrhizobium sp. GM5.1]
MHADSPFPMSQALRDGLPHVVDGARAVCGPKQKSSEPSHRTAGTRLRLHEF